MNETYLSKLTALLDASYPDLATTYDLGFKSVFGAVGGYVDDTIFVTCGAFGVALRLPSDIREEVFLRDGGSHLRYFPKGHIKKEYAVLPQTILDDGARLRDLVTRSIVYVSEL